jgi:hypothetical protein
VRHGGAAVSDFADEMSVYVGQLRVWVEPARERGYFIVTDHRPGSSIIDIKLYPTGHRSGERTSKRLYSALMRESIAVPEFDNLHRWKREAMQVITDHLAVIEEILADVPMTIGSYIPTKALEEVRNLKARYREMKLYGGALEEIFCRDGVPVEVGNVMARLRAEWGWGE